MEELDAMTRMSDCLTIIIKSLFIGMEIDVRCRIFISKEMSVNVFYRR